MIRLGLAAALLLPLPAARAEGGAEGSWPRTMTVHFVVHHQSVHLPKSFLLDIEHAHRGISRELWFLAEGMQSEKIDFYLYPDRESYLRGSFHPPPWSAGRSESRAYPNNRKVFVTYEGVRSELVTHELTHLFFAAYWKRADQSPPPTWLNEGLAVMMEGRRAPLRRPIPMRDFLNQGPKDDDPAGRVDDWYAQAGSVVTYLRKSRSTFHFKTWCDSLRDGEPLIDDLRHSYGFRSLEDFEKAWKQWAGLALAKGPAPDEPR